MTKFRHDIHFLLFVICSITCIVSLFGSIIFCVLGEALPSVLFVGGAVLNFIGAKMNRDLWVNND